MGVIFERHKTCDRVNQGPHSAHLSLASHSEVLDVEI